MGFRGLLNSVVNTASDLGKVAASEGVFQAMKAGTSRTQLPSSTPQPVLPTEQDPSESSRASCALDDQSSDGVLLTLRALLSERGPAPCAETNQNPSSAQTLKPAPRSASPPSAAAAATSLHKRVAWCQSPEEACALLAEWTAMLQAPPTTTGAAPTLFANDFEGSCVHEAAFSQATSPCAPSTAPVASLPTTSTAASAAASPSSCRDLSPGVLPLRAVLVRSEAVAMLVERVLADADVAAAVLDGSRMHVGGGPAPLSQLLYQLRCPSWRVDELVQKLQCIGEQLARAHEPVDADPLPNDLTLREAVAGLLTRRSSRGRANARNCGNGPGAQASRLCLSRARELVQSLLVSVVGGEDSTPPDRDALLLTMQALQQVNQRLVSEEDESQDPHVVLKSTPPGQSEGSSQASAPAGGTNADVSADEPAHARVDPSVDHEAAHPAQQEAMSGGVRQLQFLAEACAAARRASDQSREAVRRANSDASSAGAARAGKAASDLSARVQEMFDPAAIADASSQASGTGGDKDAQSGKREELAKKVEEALLRTKELAYMKQEMEAQREDLERRLARVAQDLEQAEASLKQSREAVVEVDVGIEKQAAGRVRCAAALAAVHHVSELDDDIQSARQQAARELRDQAMATNEWAERVCRLAARRWLQLQAQELVGLHRQLQYCGKEMQTLWKKQEDMARLGITASSGGEMLPQMPYVRALYDKSCAQVAAIGQQYTALRPCCVDCTKDSIKNIDGQVKSETELCVMYDEFPALVARLDAQLSRVRELITETSVVNKFEITASVGD